MISVYVLRGSNGKRYVGITNDVARRLAEHRAGKTRCGQLLTSPELVHVEEFPDYAAARKREVFLKSGQGRRWLDELLSRSQSA